MLDCKSGATALPHDFEPTDSQGHSMECQHCGRVIAVGNGDDWDKGLSEQCPMTV